jgi:hypothetical protein
MNRSEVAKLFAYACLFDGRLQADEGKILAWDAALHPDMTFEFAKYFVSVHYMKDEKVIAPVYFNKEWERQNSHKAEMEKSKRLAIEYDEAQSKAAPPEKVEFYVSQIRETLAKGKSSADMADGNGKVASDL